MSEQENPVFAIEKIYIKDLSVEVPNAPQIFLDRDTPNVGIQLQTKAQGIGDGIFEVTLTATVTSKIEEKTVFLVEVGQAGIFRVQNVPDENMDPLLSIACPNILYPYAREVISDTVTRAGFAPVMLQPVNFEALYMSRLQQQQEAEKDAPGEPTVQ
ncbi:MAG: protein-export chaperone SecB [Candidatus Accumulibacter sp.]|uniref:protein-export chaperone SecB n=1 Tax=Accumulibacter sp. TaxID=2053492 RepID=UPI001A0FE052|nr:protein-export chaperone SecB [Accumulibacter sp.]MBE2259929.1 protein-export chaperone SecB [Paracoccaceae bacterium]MCB1943734.1 protein-export chaperone SecB [Accumulibacter sp.]MCP5248262.1 protein-export chaperone SecB [Accumulibacter sp.]